MADRIGDVGAERIIEQLVEADDAHQAEAERKPDGHQEKDAPEAQAEDDAGGQQMGIDHLLVPLIDREPAAGDKSARFRRGSRVPQMPFSPASMTNTSTAPMISSQFDMNLLAR